MTFLEKYQPSQISQYVFEDASIEVTLKAFESGARKGPLLLHGFYGTGKSTLARLIADAQLRRAKAGFTPVCLSGMDFKSSSIGMIENVWSLGKTSFVDFTYVIIEDVDHLKGKQTSLRNLMDKSYAQGLILTTNQISQVDKGIRDRCSEHHIKLASPQQWAQTAQYIAAAEGVSITPQQAQVILAAARQSLRGYGDAIADLVANYQARAKKKAGEEAGNV